MNKKITREQLKEMIRRELKTAIKESQVEEAQVEEGKVDESLSGLESTIAAAIGLGGPALAVAIWFIKQLKKNPTKEGIKQAAQELSNSLASSRGDV